MIEEVLQKIGLTGNETIVYLALLELGESKAGKILEKSGLNSGKIYEILDSLEKKGLVSKVLKGGIKYFSPANPQRVIDYLEEKKQELINNEEDYKKILPDILKRISFTKKPISIEIYSGFKGMKTAFAKELNFPDNSTLYVMGVLSREDYPKEQLEFYRLSQYPKREAKKYKIKKILNMEAEMRGERIFHEKSAEIRYIPYASFVAINTIGNLTNISILMQEPIIISIESEEVAKSFIDQFELLWRVAKP